MQAQKAGREPLVVRARRWVGEVEAVAAGEEEARGVGGGGGGRGDRGHSSQPPGRVGGAGTRAREVGEERKGVRRGGVGRRLFWCARPAGRVAFVIFAADDGL